MNMNNIETVKKGKSSKDIVPETVTPINNPEQKTGNPSPLIQTLIENAVITYIKDLKLRNSSEARTRFDSVKSGVNIDHRILRKPEAKFQNTILKILYQKNILRIDHDHIDNLINTAIVKQLKENSIDMQSETGSILYGIESCYVASQSIEKSLKSEYPKENILIMTNDNLDAEYEIDILAGVENEEGFIKVLNLVQVKNDIQKTIERKEENIQYRKIITIEDEVESTRKKHQEYLNALPQFIGTINRKEASKLAEKEIGEVEIIDIDRNKERENQLTLFGLVLNAYTEEINNPKQANATDLYDRLKKEGLIFNPFDVMGILKSKNAMDKYRNKYFDGWTNKGIEERLKETADKIPYTDIESMIFYKKNHVHTIIDSAEFFSLVMEGETVISTIKLTHPYENIERKINFL